MTDPDFRLEPAATKRGRSRLFRLGCGATAILAPVILWTALFDVAPPDDSDLLSPTLADEPDSESLVGALIEICAELPESRSWMDQVAAARGCHWEDLPSPWPNGPLDRSVYADPELLPGMAQYIEASNAAIDRLSQSLERGPGGFRPRYPENIPWDQDYFTRGYSEIREVSSQLLDRALRLRARGDVAGSSRWLWEGIRLAERLAQDGSHSLLNGSLAFNMLIRFWESTMSLLHDGELDAEVERILIARSPQLDRDPEIPIRCLRGEYAMLRAAVLSVASDGGRAGRLVQKPNRTLRRLAEIFRIAIDEWDLPAAERSDWAEIVGTDGQAIRRAILTANRGELALGGLIPNTPGFTDRFYRCLLTERIGRTIVALRAYERTRGALPGDLGVLVHAFPALSAVPEDPYTSAPLRYDPARRILWSVGEDGVDGDGNGWEALRDDPEAKRYALPDWVWPIPPLPGGG